MEYIFLQFAFLALQWSWKWPNLSWAVWVGLGEGIKGTDSRWGWKELHQGTLSGVSVPLPPPTPHLGFSDVSVRTPTATSGREDPGRKHRGVSSRAEGGTWAERDTLGHLRVEEVDWLHQLSAFAAEPQIPPPDPNPRGPPSPTQPFLYPPSCLLPISSMQVWDILLPPKSLPRSEVHSPDLTPGHSEALRTTERSWVGNRQPLSAKRIWEKRQMENKWRWTD